jgi:hypothetical protein
MTCTRHGGNDNGSIFCKFCDAEQVARMSAQTSQEELYDIPCMELTSEQLDLLPPRELRWVLTYRAQQRAKIAEGSSE